MARLDIQHLQSLLEQEIISVDPIDGGSICDVYKVSTDAGEYCIKMLGNSPDDFFTTEAVGLNRIAATQTALTPGVISVSQTTLILQWLTNTSETKKHWINFGETLARLHQCTAETFGLGTDGYCGRTRQINTPLSNGYEFFATCRLEPQIVMARNADLLTTKEANRLEHIASRLEQWIPEQPASIVHGDLWGGNIIHTGDGTAMIDPAMHYGWRETDLAMTMLFGRFDHYFYDTYTAVWPLEPDFEQRAPLYNLYHLLNHLNLFGRGYHDQVMRICNRFS